MSFEEFKDILINRFGKGAVLFTETGKYGWTSLEQMPDKLVHGNPGPHYCEASSIPRGYYLLGIYNFKTETAEFFK
jgi:hypothetical protein